MTFARINTGGWASGAELTTAQIDQLDLDHSNALDKSAAGDGVFGSLTFTGALTVSGGASVIVVGTTKTLSGGRILLSDNDYPTFSAARALTRTLPILFEPGTSNAWFVDANYSTSNAAGASGALAIDASLLDGAVLQSVDVLFVVAAHAQVPQVLPNVSVFRVTSATGAFTVLASLRMPTPVGPSAWYNNAQIQTLNVPVGATIDKTQYQYFLSVTEEHGTGAVAGNQWHSARLNLTNIADMRPA